jgi:hypothetical protein
MTRGLEGRRSVQLSYGRRIRKSGRPDSNRGPPAPKAGALPNCATPRRELNAIFKQLTATTASWPRMDMAPGHAQGTSAVLVTIDRWTTGRSVV